LIGGPDNSLLLFVHKDTFRAHSAATGEVLHTMKLPLPVGRIAVAAFDPTLIAVSFPGSAIVYSVGDDGLIERRFAIDIADSRSTVIGLCWLPSMLFHLAVTTSEWTRVYDIVDDCRVLTCSFQGRESISSSVFLDVGGQLFIAVTTNQGRIGIAEFTGGECQIDKYIQFPNANNVCRISYSAETDVVFIWARQAPVTVIRSRDLVESVNTLNNCGVVKMGLSPLADPLFFAAVHPTRPAIHILRGALQGSLHLVEFTDTGVACHFIEGPMTASRDGLPALSYGVFPWRDTIGIVAGDGAVYRLVSGKQSGSLAVDFGVSTSEQAEENGYDFVVPATFWQAQHEKDSVVVTDELGKQCGSLQQHSSVTFNRKNVVLTISSNSTSHVICGICVTLGVVTPNLLPAAIKVANRKYTITERISRSHCFPLKPAEVFPSAPVNIQLIGDGDAMTIEGIDVFVISAAGFERPGGTKVDWTFDGKSLLDFADDENSGKCTSELEFILVSLSAAPIRQGGEAYRQAAIALLKLMYRRPDLAAVCRRVVLKAFAGSESLEADWAQAIGQACKDGAVHEDAARTLWRDYSLLGPELQHQLGDVVWNGAAGTSVHALVCALTF
jgi:hypothetical protein